LSSLINFTGVVETRYAAIIYIGFMNALDILTLIACTLSCMENGFSNCSILKCDFMYIIMPPPLVLCVFMFGRSILNVLYPSMLISAVSIFFHSQLSEIASASKSYSLIIVLISSSLLFARRSLTLICPILMPFGRTLRLV